MTSNLLYLGWKPSSIAYTPTETQPVVDELFDGPPEAVDIVWDPGVGSQPPSYADELLALIPRWATEAGQLEAAARHASEIALKEWALRQPAPKDTATDTASIDQAAQTETPAAEPESYRTLAATVWGPTPYSAYSTESTGNGMLDSLLHRGDFTTPDPPAGGPEGEPPPEE